MGRTDSMPEAHGLNKIIRPLRYHEASRQWFVVAQRAEDLVEAVRLGHGVGASHSPVLSMISSAGL